MYVTVNTEFKLGEGFIWPHGHGYVRLVLTSEGKVQFTFLEKPHMYANVKAVDYRGVHGKYTFRELMPDFTLSPKTYKKVTSVKFDFEFAPESQYLRNGDILVGISPDGAELFHISVMEDGSALIRRNSDGAFRRLRAGIWEMESDEEITKWIKRNSAELGKYKSFAKVQGTVTV